MSPRWPHDPERTARAKRLRQEAQAVRSANRRAREARAEASLSAAQWRACLRHFGNACAYCGQVPSARGDRCRARKARSRLLLSFVVPLRRGGASCAQNVVPSCRACLWARDLSSPIAGKLPESVLDWIGEPMEEREPAEVMHRWFWFDAACGAAGGELTMSEREVTCRKCRRM